MPYKVVKSGDDWKVFKLGDDGEPTGAALGTHDSSDKAADQVKALYSNEKKSLRGVSMSFDTYDDDTTFTRLEARGTSKKVGLLQSILRIANDLIGANEETDTKALEAEIEEAEKAAALLTEPVPLGPMMGFKVSADGNRWEAMYSNAAEDNSGEIFPMAETDAFIERANKGIVPMPELWYYHIPGTKHGAADWLGRVGIVTMAAGHFDKTPIAEKFKAHYKKHQQANSHGFYYDAAQVKDGVYGYYDTFEISALPVGKADNPYTVFDVIGVKAMDQAQQIKALLGIMSEAEAEALVKKGAQHSKALLERGVNFKAASETAAPTETAPTEGAKGADTTPPAPTGVEAKIDALTANVKALVDVLTPKDKSAAQMTQPAAPAAAPVDPVVAAMQAEIKALKDQLKDFTEMTPTAPTKSKATEVSADDPMVQFLAKMNSGQKDQQSEAMKGFGFFQPIIEAMSGVPTQ